MIQNSIRISENDLTVRLNGIKINYSRNARADLLPLIFVHGFPFNKSMWNNQVTALTGSYDVITYDIRGHGFSEVGNENFSIDLFVNDLISLLDHLKIEKTILCGLSLGGYISLNAISKFPDRFKGLILADTQCFADSPETKEKRMKAIELIKKGDLEKYADDSVKNLFAPGSFISRSREVADIRQMIMTTSATSLCKTLIALAERKDTCATLNKIKVPVLIMVGAEDKITPQSAAKFMNENIKSSFLKIIEQSGHLSNMENPLEFNKHLSDFLNRIS